jgi:hypothetical protein
VNIELILSVLLAAASLLAMVPAANAEPTARLYVRFAASLYTALATANLVAAVSGASEIHAAILSSAWLVMPLAFSALTLALRSRFGRNPSTFGACVVMLAACAIGLATVLTGQTVIAFTALLILLCAVLGIALQQFQQDTKASLYAITAMGSLTAGAAALETVSGFSAFLLFTAAGLLGSTAACARISNGGLEPVISAPFGDRISGAH